MTWDALQKSARKRLRVEDDVAFAIDARKLLTFDGPPPSLSVVDFPFDGGEELKSGGPEGPQRLTFEPPDIFEWYERGWD